MRRNKITEIFELHTRTVTQIYVKLIGWIRYTRPRNEKRNKWTVLIPSPSVWTPLSTVLCVCMCCWRSCRTNKEPINWRRELKCFFFNVQIMVCYFIVFSASHYRVVHTIHKCASNKADPCVIASTVYPYPSEAHRDQKCGFDEHLNRWWCVLGSQKPEILAFLFVFGLRICVFVLFFVLCSFFYRRKALNPFS
jgi:hypothetical protein